MMTTKHKHHLTDFFFFWHVFPGNAVWMSLLGRKTSHVIHFWKALYIKINYQWEKRGGSGKLEDSHCNLKVLGGNFVYQRLTLIQFNLYWKYIEFWIHIIFNIGIWNIRISIWNIWWQCVNQTQAKWKHDWLLVSTCQHSFWYLYN